MEGYATTTDLIYGGICWTLIVTCLVCAAFRWFHMCHPCNLNPDYYYPARRFVCVFYLCQLLYLPFIVRPSDPHTILYTRCVELVLTTALLPLILIRFFKPNARLAFLNKPAFYVAPLLAFAVIGVITLFWPANLFLSDPGVFLLVVGIVACAMCLVLLDITVWLWREIGRYHKAEYSNEADFPYKFAQKVLFSPWLVVGLCWVIFFTGNRVLMAVLWGLLSVFAVYYGVAILHPQRKGVSCAAEGGPEADNADLREAIVAVEAKNAAENSQPPVADGKLKDAIRSRVIEIARKRYLEPHLMRRDIIAEFDYGERTIAGAVISEFGFYDMVNMLRLEHARRYAEAHPNETKESIAVSSGFKDRFAMRHAARRIGGGSREILDGFAPEIL